MSVVLVGLFTVPVNPLLSNLQTNDVDTLLTRIFTDIFDFIFNCVGRDFIRYFNNVPFRDGVYKTQQNNVFNLSNYFMK